MPTRVRCALMDMHPLADAPGFWRCDGCNITINEHTHEATDTQGRPVSELGRAS